MKLGFLSVGLSPFALDEILRRGAANMRKTLYAHGQVTESVAAQK